MSIEIIAEIGVNHNGSMTLARQLIDEAKNSGATCVKFQTFRAETLAAKSTPKVPYQLRTSDPQESHFEMLRKLELPREEHKALMEYATDKGLVFCSTPYTRDDAVFLDQLGVKIFKIASADIIDLPLHDYIAQSGKECIVATGMASLGEIEQVLEIYDRYNAREKVVLLQCVSAYPANPVDVNLRCLQTYKAAFGCRVGFSDHTAHHYAALAAVALGACVIEKHFTLDRSMSGPDHAASATPQEFAVLSEGIREVGLALGDGVKRIAGSELDMRRISRKSIIAGKKLLSGHVLKEEDLSVRRPGTGLSPMRIPALIGKELLLPIEEGEQITPQHFK